MKKIGILLNHTYCTKNILDIINMLKEESNIKLYFLIHNKTDQKKRALKEKFYNLIFQLESKILSCFSKEIKEYHLHHKITKFINKDIVYLQPKYDTQQKDITYSSQDMTKIKELDLDLILNANVPNRLKGEILKNASKDGLISITYSDNRQFRSEKTAFWEVYLRKPSIGFSIEKIDNNSNEVLYRGEIAIMRVVTEMKVRLYKEVVPYIAKVILDYKNRGKLSPIEEDGLFSTMPLSTPSILQTIYYLFKTISLYALLVFKRKVLKKHPRFSVAFLYHHWQNAKLYEGIEIKNPPNHFYADPFVWTKHGRSVCFLEDYDYTQNIAWISAVELFEDKSYKILGSVIKEPFHMSFPYLFEYHSELYMVPETSQARSVRLYKCIEFPLKWEYQKDLLQNVSTADTMIFKHEQRWWMFTNMSTKNNDDQAAQLFAYYSDNPLSHTWEPHALNPIAFSSNYGRNGGILDADSKFPVRVRQKQKFNIYGAAFSIAKITKLSPTTFEEKLTAEIEADFFEEIKATHHMHSHNNITVYDFMRYETVK